MTTATAASASRSTHTGNAAVNRPDEDASDSLRKAAILVVSLEEPLAAQLLAWLDRPAVEAVTLEMARLERIDADEQRAVLEEFFALGLQRLRFVFEDLVRLDGSAIRLAYHEEDEALWALALAGAARPVQASVFEALPPEHSVGLRQRLSQMGPFRLADAEGAQTELAERLRRLHDHGRISLPNMDGQEDAVV